MERGQGGRTPGIIGDAADVIVIMARIGALTKDWLIDFVFVLWTRDTVLPNTKTTLTWRKLGYWSKRQWALLQGKSIPSRLHVTATSSLDPLMHVQSPPRCRRLRPVFYRPEVLNNIYFVSPLNLFKQYDALGTADLLRRTESITWRAASLGWIQTWSLSKLGTALTISNYRGSL